MSDFWAGYLLGRSGGDGPSIPPGLALVFLGLLAFVGVLYVLQGVYTTIEGVTQSHPVVSLLGVGAVTVGVSARVGTTDTKAVARSILGRGIVGVGLAGAFWVIRLVSGASSFEQASGGVQLVLGVLSLGIVAAFAAMVLALVQYQGQTRAGRVLRAGSLVLFAWWAWSSAFALPLGMLPGSTPAVFLIAGTIAALTTGGVES